jgi:hypothetical protein
LAREIRREDPVPFYKGPARIEMIICLFIFLTDQTRREDQVVFLFVLAGKGREGGVARIQSMF